MGDVEHSLKGEVGIVDPVPVEDPDTAEVALAMHGHGPVQPGNVMAQLTSFLGGCQVLTGIPGFAQGPEDMPDEVGGCTLSPSRRTCRLPSREAAGRCPQATGRTDRAIGKGWGWGGASSSSQPAGRSASTASW